MLTTDKKWSLIFIKGHNRLRNPLGKTQPLQIQRKKLTNEGKEHETYFMTLNTNKRMRKPKRKQKKSIKNDNCLLLFKKFV